MTTCRIAAAKSALLPLTMLRALATVYETGGARSAARRLNITHSAVSRHLKELEAWLGTPLLVRTEGRRTLTFSREGQALGQVALSCLSELESAVTSLREFRRRHSVTVSTTPSFAARWLLPRLGSLQANFPRLEVSVIVDQRVHAPADEGADLAIRMGGRAWPGFTCLPLMDDALYPVVSPAYWAEHGRPDTLRELLRLRLLHDRDPNASWAVWKKHHGPKALDTRTGARFTSSDLVLCGAEHGLGVALARNRLASDAIQSGALVRPFGDARVPAAAGVLDCSFRWRFDARNGQIRRRLARSGGVQTDRSLHRQMKRQVAATNNGHEFVAGSASRVTQDSRLRPASAGSRAPGRAQHRAANGEGDRRLSRGSNYRDQGAYRASPLAFVVCTPRS